MRGLPNKRGRLDPHSEQAQQQDHQDNGNNQANQSIAVHRLLLSRSFALPRVAGGGGGARTCSGPLRGWVVGFYAARGSSFL